MTQNENGFRASISIEYTEEEKLIATRLYAHRRQALEAENELTKIIKEREDVKIAQKLVHHAAKVEVQCNEKKGLVNFRIANREDHPPVPKNRQPYTYRMDFSTLNAVINNKLIEPHQKRALLRKMYPDMADCFDEPEPAEPDPRGYTGKIDVGYFFWWAPGTEAQCAIRVTRIDEPTALNERRIWSLQIDMSGMEEVWNDESSFREAVMQPSTRQIADWSNL